MAEAVKSGGLRTTALLIFGAGTIFWLYTFYGIAQVPSGDGSGMQWIAIMPLGLIPSGFFGIDAARANLCVVRLPT
jgi:hypothetical protein